MRRTILIIIFLLFVFSCKKDETKLYPGGQITLSSQTFGTMVYYSMGYSFEKEKYVQTLGSSEIIDIYLVEANTISGTLTGVQFATKEIPESTYGFYLNGVFPTFEEAEDYYNNYTSAVAPQFVVLTDTIRVNQVWTFRTYQKNYVKILVKDLRTIYTGQTADYIEVDIRYFIQRDGSADLTE